MIAHALMMLLLAAPFSGRPTVVTKLPPHSRLTVGDRFEVELIVRSANKSLVTGPLADSMGAFVVAREKRGTKVRTGYDESTYRLSVAGFQPGTHTLPAFVFLVQSGAKTDTLKSDTASVAIASVMPGKMKDINGLAAAETFPNVLLWMVPAALLLLAALAYVGLRLYRRLRRIHELAQAPLPPWEEALRALEALPRQEWLATGQVKRYYYALSEVLKRYIERRFDFDAAEQTTTEMLASMRAHKTPMRDEVARFFGRSDLVKYAKSVPTPDEAEAAIEQVREFVMKSKPQDPVPAPVPATPGAVTVPGSA